jgi:hypothetical protein
LSVGTSADAGIRASQAPVRHGERKSALHLPRPRQGSLLEAYVLFSPPSTPPSFLLTRPLSRGWGESADDDKKDLERPGIEQNHEIDRLPKHLRKEWTRSPSKVNPDVCLSFVSPRSMASLTRTFTRSCSQRPRSTRTCSSRTYITTTPPSRTILTSVSGLWMG